jgi:hypothetical protein
MAGALMTLLSLTARADTAPPWVRSALEQPIGSYEKSAPFVVLADERVTTVRENGRSESRWRYAVRILTQEGRAAARREIYYDSQIRISDLHAWHIRADQKVFELEQHKVIEESRYDNLYSDIKSKVMRFGEVEVGSVVAFEWVQKEKPLVNQDFHFFQSRSPVVVSRYRLILPAGWQVHSAVFNHAPIEPVVEGSAYTWQLEGLSAVEEEPWMPDTAELAPYLAVSYFPPRADAAKKSIRSWEDVSRWADDLMKAQTRERGVVESKARELTSGLASDIEKARSLARWVQKSIRYASIQLSAIGGYRPYPADAVLKKGYGDCKDKSALLQTLLRAVGIESFMTLVYAGDAFRVRPEFPSPLQFNHAILAISIDANLSATIADARLGRLVFFDPTDDQTPLGDLPFYLQGSYGLVVKAESGKLIRLPAQEEEANKARREIDVQVGSGGEVSAEVREVYTGQMASALRRRLASLSAEECVREILARVSRDLPGASITDLKINREAELEEPLRISYEIKAVSSTGRLNRLLVVRPLILRAQQFPLFTRAERFSPVRFEMKSVQEDVAVISLPEGFRIDELPSETRLQSGFGEFGIFYKFDRGRVVAQRRLAISALTTPVSYYAEVKRFFDSALSASQTNIVLISQ